MLDVFRSSYPLQIIRRVISSIEINVVNLKSVVWFVFMPTGSTAEGVRDESMDLYRFSSTFLEKCYDLTTTTLSDDVSDYAAPRLSV